MPDNQPKAFTNSTSASTVANSEGRFTLVLSPENPNRRDIIESHHAPGGLWEQRHGTRQTRRYAESFHAVIELPRGVATVLDLGCGLGDALPVWKSRYPHVSLFGCDVTDNSVARCRARYGHIATIFKAGFEELADFYDVIYCSHVLEHFEQHVEIARHLLRHCHILYVLTPFNELRNYRQLRPQDGDWHVATLYSDSFDDLLRGGEASSIEYIVVPCPSTPLRRAIRLLFRACSSAASGKPQFQESLQIVYTIMSSVAYTGYGLRDREDS